MPGQKFTSVPPSGFLTDGNDTLIGGALAQDVNALGGEDLLVLDYRSFAGSLSVYFEDFGGASTASILRGALGFVYADNFELLRLTATEFSDFIYSNLGNATLRGMGGDDHFWLGGGNNLVFGGAGDDFIEDAQLSDRVFGGAGFDLLNMDLSGLTEGVTVGRGFNRDNWRGIEMLGGTLTDHDDIFHGSTSLLPAGLWVGFDAVVYGGLGTDRLILDYSRLDGGDALHLSEFSLSVDYAYAQVWEADWTNRQSQNFYSFEIFDITGTASDDRFQQFSGMSTLRGGQGDDEFTIYDGFATVFGGAGDDTLYNFTSDPVEFHGGAGNDRVVTRLRDDTLFGGGGFDTLEIDLSQSAQGPIEINLSDLADGTNWRGFEFLTGFLTGFDDTVTGHDYIGNLSGEGGQDFLRLDYLNGRYASVHFGMIGSEFTPVSGLRISDGEYDFGVISEFEIFDIRGTDGDDIIVANDGNDSLRGADGADSIFGGGGDDTIEGNAGDDYLQGGTGNDLLMGGAGDDTLEGGFGADTLYGGAGDDHIEGEQGNDLIYGGAGNDEILAGAGSDLVYGGGGDDIIRGEDGADELHGDAGHDFIDGGAGNDLIFGGTGRDTLIGGAGNDTLYGGDGHDILFGGAGNDILYGGAGADRFLFLATDQGFNRIADFDTALDTLAFAPGVSMADLTFRNRTEGARVEWAGGTIVIEGVALVELDLSRIEFDFILLGG